MSQLVFNRYEYKYIISRFKAARLMDVLNKHLELDSYCQEHGYYLINNEYVDTINNDLISKSITKPLYKHKFRIRSYGENSDLVFFEIKKKYLGLVNKRRCELSYDEAKKLLNKQDLNKDENEQIIKEIKYLMSHDDYEIKNKISYKRVAYMSHDKELRISFDYDINSLTNQLLKSDQMLLEIKTSMAIPLWLVLELNELNIQRTSYSKYGTDFIINLSKEI